MPDRVTAEAFVPGAEGAVVVHAIRGEEELSRAFSYRIDLTCSYLDYQAALGNTASVRITDHFDVEHFVSGTIDRVESIATDEPAARFRLHLVPAHAQLALRHGFRIFQDLSVPDIVKKVFKDAGLRDEVTRLELTGSYPAREYCVQYDESEWDFVCRLMEHEGIFFRFEHAEDGHVMVLADDSTRAPQLDPDHLAFDAGVAIRHSTEPSIHDVKSRSKLTIGKATTRDYDRLHPSLDLEGQAEGESPFGRERYDYPSGARTAAEGKRLAEARLEAERSTRKIIVGTTDALSALPGRRFTLLDHALVSGDLVITRADVFVLLHDEDGTGPLTEPGSERAEVMLQMVPKEQKFRATPKTPRPRVYGWQTARVTGPLGEEIHCDDLGRVKLQFHWDREGQLDDKTSCWVRVMQQHTTGSVHVPRIGWEVLVAFDEGDPDRPVCFGRVYNPAFPPEYALPAQKTVTGLRSNASPGAGCVNEIMMDDVAGSQLLQINAGRDLMIRAANDKRARIGNDLTYTVSKNRTAHVGGNESSSIDGQLAAAVGKTQSISIGGKREMAFSGGGTIEAAGSYTLDVGGMEHMQVGNPAEAILEVLTSAAIDAASGAAAKAAERAEAAVLGPLAPVLKSARENLGTAARVLGPAAAAASGGHPGASMLGNSAALMSNSPGAQEAGSISAGIAQAALSGKLAEAVGKATKDALTKASKGDDAAAGGPAGKGGSGVWATAVAGSMTESVGAVASIASVKGLSFSIGGDSSETIGAARIEMIKGGKVESSTTKIETVAAYVVQAKEDIAFEAEGAVAITVASQTQKIGEGHAISAKGAVAITAPKIDLTASGKVTFTCGQAEVVVSGSGVAIKGAKKVTIEGTNKLKLKPPAIAPG